jgi:hypothetical protein
MGRRFKNNRSNAAFVISLVALVFACAGSAVAGSVISSAQIKNNSITGKDIKNRSIGLADLSKRTRKALYGPAGANGANGANGKDTPPGGNVSVTGASSIFEAKRNVTITPSGANIGPLADSSEAGAVIYHGLDGHALKDLAQVAYTASYIHDPGPANVNGPDNGDAPYMLITLNGFDHDIAFSPSTQPGACYSGTPSSPQCNSSGRSIHYEVSKGTVRYDDDPGSLPDQTWAQVVTDHGDDVISGIRVQAGFSLPGTASALVNSLTVEAKGIPPTTYYFGS